MAADVLTLLLRLNLAAAFAILCVAVLRAPARRLFGPGVAYALWLAVPLASAAAFLPARTKVALAPPALPIDSMARMAIEWTVPAAPTAPMVASPAMVDTAILLLGLWIAGAAIALCAVAVLHRRSLASLGRLEATGERVMLRSEGAWSGPAVIGALRPRIVIPADFEERFTASEQAMVVTHERIHLARGDALINAIVVLFQCLNWVNPLVHLGARLLRLDQEMACDAAVLDRHPDARRAYAQAMLKTQLAPLQSPLGCYWPARSRHPLKERFAVLKMKPFSRRRRLLGATTVALIVASAGYGAWASNDEVLVVTQDVVEATARPVEIRLAQAAPTLIERTIDAKPLEEVATGQAPGLAPDRPLSELERAALDGARAALAEAKSDQQLALVPRSQVAAQAARLAELEMALGQRPATADEALRLAEAEIENVEEDYKVGLARRTDIGLATERLVRLQLALGQRPGVQPASASISGDFDADGRADTAAIVAVNGGYDLVVRPGDSRRSQVKIMTLDDPSRVYLRKAKPGVEATSCAEGSGAANAPCPRRTVTVTGDTLEFGTPEASRAVALWTGGRFDVVWLDD